MIEAGCLSAEVSGSLIQANEQCKRVQHFPGCGLPPFQYHAEELLAFKMRHQQLANVGDSVNAGFRAEMVRYCPAFGPPHPHPGNLQNEQIAFLPCAGNDRNISTCAIEHQHQMF